MLLVVVCCLLLDLSLFVRCVVSRLSVVGCCFFVGCWLLFVGCWFWVIMCLLVVVCLLRVGCWLFVSCLLVVVLFLVSWLLFCFLSVGSGFVCCSLFVGGHLLGLMCR